MTAYPNGPHGLTPALAWSEIQRLRAELAALNPACTTARATY